MIKHWNKLRGNTVESPFLETGTHGLDTGLSNLFWVVLLLKCIPVPAIG